MNPNQRLTSLKWRKEVLTRVHRLLYLLLEKNKPKENSINVVSNIELNHQQAPLYTKRDFNLKLTLQKPGHSNAIVGTSSNLLQEFIAHLFPLLIETWVEAMAGEQLNKGQGIVAELPKNQENSLTIQWIDYEKIICTFTTDKSNPALISH